MIRERYRTTAGIFLSSDLAATLLAFFLAWLLRFELEVVPLTKNVPEFGPYLSLLPFILVCWPVVFYFHGLYQVRRGRSQVEEAFTIVAAVGLAVLLLSGLSTWYRQPVVVVPGKVAYFTYSRAFLALFAAIDLAFVVVGRAVIRYVLRLIRLSGQNIQRILVIGAGALGKEITQKLIDHRELGFEVVGFLDDDPGKAASSFVGVPVLGQLKDLSPVLEEQGVDQVVLCLPLEAHKKILRILNQVERECVEVKLVPDILQYATLNASVEDLDGIPVINLSQMPMQGWYSLAKRAMDVAFSLAGILALLPALPVTALLIWIEDHGPIFYRQERMGLDGRTFWMLKFRSMRVDAESSTGPVWAVREDPRRTVVGSFLRRWSLDELPQLWNVLKGEMSLVGPRPERPRFVHEFKHRIPQYMLRHRVKAGITGWAQVHGWRGNTSIRKRIQYDLYYIQNWSLLLDLKILWMTIRFGLDQSNAY